jgi:hypothetical protein
MEVRMFGFGSRGLMIFFVALRSISGEIIG